VETLAFEDGTYRTPQLKVSFLAKALPSVFCFWGAIGQIVESASLSKRGLYDHEAWALKSLGVIRAIEAVGVKFEITGAELIASVEGPCVFVANHMSTLETLCLPAIILPYKPVTFVVKKSLTEYPVFKHIMRATNAIAVSRENPRDDLKEVLVGGEKMLREGTSVVVFPQTTRTTDFKPEEFNSLGVKLARRAGVPVVPVAIKSDAWGVGPMFLKDFGKIDPSKPVRMSFGRPLTVSGRGDEEHRETIEFISSRLQEWSA
jgi:1-acyl-sn-glycerol-3-phosphate acyltransferase